MATKTQAQKGIAFEGKFKTLTADCTFALIEDGTIFIHATDHDGNNYKEYIVGTAKFCVWLTAVIPDATDTRMEWPEEIEYVAKYRNGKPRRR